jgi:hypothetical protein
MDIDPKNQPIHDKRKKRGKHKEGDEPIVGVSRRNMGNQQNHIGQSQQGKTEYQHNKVKKSRSQYKKGYPQIHTFVPRGKLSASRAFSPGA